MRDEFDVVIIGAGIAGASAAYEIAADRRVLVVEREDHPGYHTTGRSAAVYAPNYGNAAIRAITAAARDFYTNPPDGFAATPLLSARGALTIGGVADTDTLERDFKEFAVLSSTIRAVDQAEALRMVPVLDPASCAGGGLFEPAALDMDVHAIHQGYLKGLSRRGGEVRTTAEVTAIERTASLWTVVTPGWQARAPVVVNAAGAWADVVGALAGAPPIGLVPKRRTAITVDVPAGLDIHSWPLAVDAHETFYFKPDAGRILASPADATPSPPCDAQPEELDIAILIDRLQTATSLRFTRLASRWAGLRSFVADGTMVAGFEPGLDGFFWLAGQGGYGIQTAPAMARIAAALSGGGAMPSDVQAFGVVEATLSPTRLSRTVAALH
jgi:D-arginine dehydrogenase